MHQLSMAKFWHISEINFKLAVLPNTIPALLCLMIIPFIRGISNLDSIHSAQCLEQSAVLAGIFLIVPLCQPEQPESIREIISNKIIPEWFLLLVRMLSALLILIILICGFSFIMILNNCKFEYVRYTTGTIVSAAALGYTGLLTAVISNSAVAGYLVSSGYFFSNFAGNGSGKNIFYLFSISDGDCKMKIWIFICDVILAALCLIYKKIKRYY